jgi:hypothetical protein
MRNALLIYLTILASCSSPSTSTSFLSEQDRSIASVSDLNCVELVKGFKANGDNSKKKLLASGVLRPIDLEVLDHESIKNFLSQSSVDKENVELSILLIKKRFAHFEDDQLIANYQLLTKYCGID